MELKDEKVRKLVDFYQKLVPEGIRVSRFIVGSVIDNDTEGNFYKDEKGNKLVNSYTVKFQDRDDQYFSLEKAILKFNLPEPEKVLLQIQ